ncbi:MAG: class I SAM-dependent RNA methyltransferase [Candidatus Omnitrophica bacterium]|nr:class I SAM-dependent RNA methyltransferase [Candidatus Omnitrophota bacterium]
MKKIVLIAVMTFGLESIVRKELEDLGYKKIISVSDGRIEFEAEVKDIPIVNLWLRTADRVVIKMAEFKALDFDQLFDNIKSIPWEEWITKDGKITVNGKSVKSVLESVRSNQSITKKAIIERLKAKYNIDWLEETGPEFEAQVSIYKDMALLTLDTTGFGLHRRNYRTSTGEVPLRENLAAALVLLSFWKKDRLLIDPLCGSGTILIEAAMIARNIAPGLNRDFASEQWPGIPIKYWTDARDAALNAIDKTIKPRIFGYDIDPQRIKDCKINTKNAGVGNDVIYQQKDIKDLILEETQGIIISNPPYGIKLSTAKEVLPIYSALDELLKNKPGWSLFLLTADKNFPNHFKRARPDKIRKLYNGTIEAGYYQYYSEKEPKQLQ